EGTLQFFKKGADSPLATLDIEIADNDYGRQTGLMYRKGMQQQQAMLFIFEDGSPRSFYMKNTLFALDIIYINSKKQVVGIQKNAKPLDLAPLPSHVPAKYVLEVNAGLSGAWQLQAGDSVSFKKH
ncbi:MAG: DUF192 domain-containing protein, partial [Marinirhabdus sp.]